MKRRLYTILAVCSQRTLFLCLLKGDILRVAKQIIRFAFYFVILLLIAAFVSAADSVDLWWILIAGLVLWAALAAFQIYEHSMRAAHERVTNEYHFYQNNPQFLPDRQVQPIFDQDQV